MRVVYVLVKLPHVSGLGLGEVKRYRMVSELTLAISRARGGSVRGHLGCNVGTRCTDVAHAPLALDA